MAETKLYKLLIARWCLLRGRWWRGGEGWGGVGKWGWRWGSR